MMNNKVKVLMSTYNGQKYLREQLDSILHQEGVGVSILVRDDGSTDETLSILSGYVENYPNIELIKGENIGFAESFMSLVYKTSEYDDIDYYAFSDQDDVWLPDKLSSAVAMLETISNKETPNLYFSTARAVDENLNFLFDTVDNNWLVISKPTSLVRYYMLGCTMVFPQNTARFLCEHKPVNKIQMHDLWINQTCVFFGTIVYDRTPHILYRQHGGNAAGASISLMARLRRFRKSFSTYERRHFRELNAQCLLSTYFDLLPQEDRDLISIVADYRKTLNNRLRFLTSKQIYLGTKTSDLMMKIRILFGFA